MKSITTSIHIYKLPAGSSICIVSCISDAGRDKNLLVVEAIGLQLVREVPLSLTNFGSAHSEVTCMHTVNITMEISYKLIQLVKKDSYLAMTHWPPSTSHGQTLYLTTSYHT